MAGPAARAALLAGLFPQQRAFVEDQSRGVVADCSRRAGKSHGIFWRLEAAAQRHPRETSVYVAPTLAVAKEILEYPQRQMAELGIATEWREWKGSVYLHWPNGARTWVAGCSDRSEIRKFKGKRYSLAVVDECQDMVPVLEELTRVALSPALIDLSGALVLSGVPGPIAAGPWHEAATNAGFTRHHWTLRDNPHIANADEELAQMRERFGWTEETPQYVREYLGRWVLDRDALVYHYSPTLNQWDGRFPEGRIRTVLSVDLGASAASKTTAMAVLSTVQGHPQVFVRAILLRSRQSTSATAAWILDQRREWDASSVVVDAGGLGSAYVDDLVELGCDARCAEKSAKSAYIEGLNGDLQAGMLLFDPFTTRPWRDEACALVWDTEQLARGKRVYSDLLSDHACDAVLYGWRDIRPAMVRPEREPPREGSVEWQREDIRRALEAARRRR